MKQKFIIMNSVTALILLALLVFMVVNVAAAISHAVNIGSSVSFQAVGRVNATVTMSHTSENAITLQKNSGAVIESNELVISENDAATTGNFALGDLELLAENDAVSEVAYSYTIEITNNYTAADAATYKYLKVTFTPPETNSCVSVNYDENYSWRDGESSTKVTTIGPGATANIEVVFSTDITVSNTAKMDCSFVLENAESSGEEEEIEYWDGSAAENFAVGDGTEANPYLISNGNELALMAYLVNNKNSATSCTNAEYTINGKTTTINVPQCGAGVTFGTAYYTLTNDIYLNDETFTFEEDTGLVKVTDGTNTCYLGTGTLGKSGGNNVFDSEAGSAGAAYENNTTTTSIASAPAYCVLLTYGNESNRSTIYYSMPVGVYNGSEDVYHGTFEGSGYEINGLYTNSSENYSQGLFGFIESGAIIQNVGVVNSFVKGDWNTGVLCGGAYEACVIKNCYNSGIVCGDGWIGGVCGGTSTSCTITDCYNMGVVTGPSPCIGGVCGSNSLSTITNCYNMGDVSDSGVVSGSGESIGGVCAYSGGTITNCYNMGDVSGSGERVGGVCGQNSYVGIISNCYNTGEVSGTADVGGVCGENENGIITNCYNTGAVSGGEYVGGVCGESYRSGTITNCYNTGDVTGTQYVGGVCGYNYSCTISGCYYLSGCATIDSATQLGIGGSTSTNSTDSGTTARGSALTASEVLEFLNTWVEEQDSEDYKIWTLDGSPHGWPIFAS